MESKNWTSDRSVWLKPKIFWCYIFRKFYVKSHKILAVSWHRNKVCIWFFSSFKLPKFSLSARALCCGLTAALCPLKPTSFTCLCSRLLTALRFHEFSQLNTHYDQYSKSLINKSLISMILAIKRFFLRSHKTSISTIFWQKIRLAWFFMGNRANRVV